MRTIFLWVAFAAVACGGKAVVDAGGAGGAGGTGGTSTSTASNPMLAGPTPVCPPHSDPGCCFGDGGCCDCVSNSVCQQSTFQEPTTATTAFDDCVCQAAVCLTECSSACAGNGIDQGCNECAKKAAAAQCATEWKACPINN